VIVGLFMGLLTLPLAPVRGVVWLAEQIEEEAARQLSDPEAIRAQLAAIDEAYEAGDLTADERDAMQDELVGRLVQPFGLGVDRE
jgi:hypothetical protein